MLDWLAHAAISHPDRIALVCSDRQWRYAELNELVAELAGRLAAAGVAPGDHVAVLMTNRVEFVGAIHALVRLGAVIVPLNIRLTAAELRWQIDRADCGLLLCSRETENQAAALQDAGGESAAVLRTLSVTCTEPCAEPRRSRSDRPQTRAVEVLADQPAQVDAFRKGRPLDLEAVQGIVFTSGTTGRPKGAMLTYRNHLMSATASAFRLGTSPEDRWLVCLPLYHVGGQAIVLRCCLYGTTVVLHDGFDAAAVNRALDTQGITLVSLVPTMLHRVLETRDGRPFPEDLRCVLLGGAPTPASLLEKSLELGVPVATTYGLTEAASQVATARPADVRRKAGETPGGPGHYVGKPLMFSEVRIVGEDGEARPTGEIGEIVVRGPMVMKGYRDTSAEPSPGFGAETKSEIPPKASLRENPKSQIPNPKSQIRNPKSQIPNPKSQIPNPKPGWLYTGDMGYLDAAGDLWMVQRRSDLIVSGGENIYPAEVEGVLLEHPAVKAVCVVGLEDEEWGQRVAAAVVVAENAALTEGELMAFCDACLAGYKRPRVVRFVDALPRTASGKVRRNGVVALLLR